MTRSGLIHCLLVALIVIAMVLDFGCKMLAARAIGVVAGAAIGAATHPQAPDKTYVKWDDTSDWVDESTAKIKGTVVNSHTAWSIDKVMINVEFLDSGGNVVGNQSMEVSPGKLTPGSRGSYSKSLKCPANGENIRTKLTWTWIPP